MPALLGKASLCQRQLTVQLVGKTSCSGSERNRFPRLTILHRHPFSAGCRLNDAAAKVECRNIAHPPVLGIAEMDEIEIMVFIRVILVALITGARPVKRAAV